MAPNSLFAILLRSRWWLSFAAAAGVTLVCMLALPAHIAPFGALAATPLWVVGGIAAWRQLRAPSPAQVERLLAECANQPWRGFAQQLEKAWRAEGYSVEVLGPGVIDFRLERAGQTTLVSARRWKAALHGVEPLRELQAARVRASADKAVYVALQPLGENAALYARDQQLVVLAGADLAALLAKASH
ncbi:MAG: restriction endonuclease [Comamonas sp.]